MNDQSKRLSRPMHVNNSCSSKLALLLAATGFFTFSALPQSVTSVGGGDNFSLFLKSDGSLWRMGNPPNEILTGGAAIICAGPISSDTLLIETNGSLWGMGENFYGELGDGHSPQNAGSLEKIVSDNVIAISRGYQHNMFLTKGGGLWVMGNNQYGQLGDGTFNSTNRPEEIVASNVTGIAAGEYHSLFVKSDGSLWAMGHNQYGALGDNTYNDTNAPEMILSNNVVAVAAGYQFSLLIRTNGSLWGMGYNANGQLGSFGFSSQKVPSEILHSNVVAIAAGAEHSLFVKRDASLWAMGNDYYGQLGDGNYGSLMSGAGSPEEIESANVTAIAAGSYHSLFIKNDGSLWAMGLNGSGQLGGGTGNETNLPEEIVPPPQGYDQILLQPLANGKARLSFVGMPGTNYALDRSFTLASPNWVPQTTNAVNLLNALVFTNVVNQMTNTFWRIRMVP
ncbi:MAG TPA: hypothetical protein VGJ73_15225 [Verrucomicrobiae bacterium]